MKLLKIIFAFFCIPLTLLLLISILGFGHRLTHPGYKSLSNFDFKQLGFAIAINLAIIALIWIAKRFLRKTDKTKN